MHVSTAMGGDLAIGRHVKAARVRFQVIID